MKLSAIDYHHLNYGRLLYPYCTCRLNVIPYQKSDQTISAVQLSGDVQIVMTDSKSLHQMSGSRNHLCSNSLYDIFPSGSKLKHSNNMLIFQFRKISKDFLICHTGAKPAQNIADRNSCSDNTGFSKSDIRIIGNITSEISHNRTMSPFLESVNRKNTVHFTKNISGKARTHRRTA